MQIDSSTTRHRASESQYLASAVQKSTSFPRGNLTVASILATDFVALFLSIGLTVVVRLILAGNYNFIDYLSLWPMIGIFLFAFALAGLYPGVPMNPINELRKIFSAVSVVFLIFGAFIFLSRSDTTWSRGIFLVACPISAVTVVLSRSGLRHGLARKPWWGVPTVLLGGGRAGQTMAETLSQFPWIGLKIIAVLDEGNEGLQSWSEQRNLITGKLDTVNRLTQKWGVKYAIVSMPIDSKQAFSQILEKYADQFHHIIIIPDFFGFSSLWVTAQDIGGMLGLEIRQALLQRWPRLLKRMLDLVITITGGLLLLPVCLLIGLVIKLTSSGPMVYGQKRIGQNNRHFTAWKFRTMVNDADEVLNHHLESNTHLKEEWQSNHKLRNDPRVTPIGRILRRTSLDELPQLWNVIIGEMSLVGPRPIVDAEVLKYGSRFQLYCKVRPGITGLWQVSGRNNTGYEKRLQLDEYYVRNWSVWLDLYILGRTLGSILRCAGAY
jgi:Undecaprenyl-phosphate galactose phosphotransferase WbaP